MAHIPGALLGIILIFKRASHSHEYTSDDTFTDADTEYDKIPKKVVFIIHAVQRRLQKKKMQVKRMKKLQMMKKTTNYSQLHVV